MRAINVNIVTVRSGWILQKIANRIAEAGNKHVGNFTVKHVPTFGVDINFYCDVQNCYRGNVVPGKHVGLFTHVHENNINTVSPMTYQLDHIFHMSRKYMDMFVDNNLYPAEKMDLMIPWEIPEDFPPKKPVIGIFQRGKYEGKGFTRMMNLFATHKELAQRFLWVFCGNDWEKVVEMAEVQGIDARQWQDKEVSYPEGYSDMYNLVDYVLIPSKWEGGPIASLEACAKGIPLISADVGWVLDLVPSARIFTDDAELVRRLSDILFEVDRRVRCAKKSWIDDKPISYERCATQIVEVV